MLKIEQNDQRDTVSIEGIVFAQAVFHSLASFLPLGQPFALVERRADGVLVIKSLRMASYEADRMLSTYASHVRTGNTKAAGELAEQIAEHLTGGVTAQAERAFVIADEAMFELIHSEAVPYDSPADEANAYGLVDEKCQEVATLEAAAPALREAFEWLRDRGYVELASDGVGAYIRVIRRPSTSGVLTAIDAAQPTLDGVEAVSDANNRWFGDMMILQVLADSDNVNEQEREVLTRWMTASDRPTNRADGFPARHRVDGAASSAAALIAAGDQAGIAPAAYLRTDGVALPRGGQPE